VIGDNASDDATPEVATLDDPRVRYHRWDSLVDVNGNFNRTAALCSGEWLVPLGSDDRLRPHALATFAEHIRNRADLVMVVAACSRIDQDGHPAAGTWRFYQGMARFSPGDYDAASWMAAMSAEGQPPWNLGSIAFRRRAVEQLGGLFDPDAGPASDIELVLRMPLAGPVRYVDDSVMVFTQRTDSDAKLQQRSNRIGSDDTILARGLRVGVAAHERVRGPLEAGERRRVDGLIARSFIQRAAQHRLLAGGAGRRGAITDLRNAWRTSPTTVLTARQLFFAAGAILAPTALLRAADRALRLERA
jgi:GT2 family glycosyltransferase